MEQYLKIDDFFNALYLQYDFNSCDEWMILGRFELKYDHDKKFGYGNLKNNLICFYIQNIKKICIEFRHFDDEHIKIIIREFLSRNFSIKECNVAIDHKNV